MHKRYLQFYLLFLLLLFFPILGNYLYLNNAGELLSDGEIVKKQLHRSDECLAGMATRNLGYNYKKELALATRPNILILGSSRVMQFKKELFSYPIVNLGGGMNCLNSGFRLISDILQEHKPQLIILGLDFWWFNANINNPVINRISAREYSNTISFRNYFMPFRWLYEKKIDFPEYIRTALSNPFTTSTLRPHIGVEGNVYNAGFGKDGSHHNTGIITGNKSHMDARFKLTMHRIENQGNKFTEQGNVNTVHLQNFLEMVALIQAHGIKLVIVLPPISPTAQTALGNIEKTKDFITTLRATLIQETQFIPYFDFHDPSTLETSDCEFIDGFHGGDITYARMLLKIASNPEYGDSLAPFFDIHKVKNIINKYSGFAMLPNQAVSAQKEVDFLEIGCPKAAL